MLVAEEATRSVLPVPPLGVGLIGLGVLLALLGATYAFRNIGHRN